MDNIVPVIYAILMLFITVQYGLEMSPSMYEERLLPSAGGHSPATCIVLGGCLECCSTTTRTVSVLVEDYNTSYTTIRDKVSKLSFALLLQFTNYKWEIIPYCKLNTFYLWGKMLCRTRPHTKCVKQFNRKSDSAAAAGTGFALKPRKKGAQ